MCEGLNSDLPTILQALEAALRVLLSVELDVHVADHVLADVIANVHLLDSAIFLVHFGEDLFEKVVKELLLLVVDLTDLGFVGWWLELFGEFWLMSLEIGWC